MSRDMPNFKVEIGQTIKDNKRNLTITDREYRTKHKKGGRKENEKYYKYTCNNCNWTEGWIREANLLSAGQGCPVCCSFPQIVAEGINDINTTAPWMVEYFKNKEDAKKYNKISGKKVLMICPDCGREKIKTISDLYNYGFGCSCKDNKSYAEKFMMNVLEQLNIDFETEYSPKWEGINKRRYDFYFEFNGDSYVVETHGEQHYKEGFSRFGGRSRSLVEEQQNDKEKEQIALKNGIKEGNYIAIDCRKSELEFIKNNVYKSKLNKTFDLNVIDWNKVGEFACKNLVKEVCEIKRSNPKITTTEISKIIKLSTATIIKYLKQGTELNWCYYNAKEESSRISRKTNMFKGKPVKIFKDGVELGEYPSRTELSRRSKRDLRVKLISSSIANVCNGKKKQYKGFTFKYI